MKGQILAGWASVEITPAKRVSLQGQNYERISEGVNDPLFATALALESEGEDDQKEQAVLISCDLIVIRRSLLERLRKELAKEKLDLDGSKIIINAIHNHTGPYYSDVDMSPEFEEMGWKELKESEFLTPTAYFDFLVEKLKELVIQAWNSRQLTEIAHELRHAVVGHCRRVVYQDGTATMYGKTDCDAFQALEGGSDHGLELLYFFADNELTGVVFNVACPSQVVELKKFISADFVGAARRMIKKRFSDKVFVLPQISAAGDQSPRDLVRRGKSESDMFSLAGVEELGNRIADEVEKGYAAACKDKTDCFEFRHKTEQITLPIRKVTNEEIAWAKRKQEEIEENGSAGVLERLNCSGILERAEYQREVSDFKMELHAIRLGEIAFVTNPFELFLEYGLRIKARSRAVQTFVIQLACDFGAYLPTKKAVKGGSYSAAVFSGIVGPEGGSLLAEHSIRVVNSLWNE